MQLEKYFQRHVLHPAFIQAAPSKELSIIVVIPCFDEPNILPSLFSLQASAKKEIYVEVIVVINSKENAPSEVLAQNQETFKQIEAWKQENELDFFKVFCICVENMPRKKGGVGMARKIGMDEAARRLGLLQKNRGIIACFDADSLCQENYFEALKSFFRAHPKLHAAGLHFEHPLTNYPTEDQKKAILDYELHLRYFINAQRYARHPHAFQTIGSSMAVTCEGYIAQGGMNTRQAGEDFYFLQKFIQVGAFGELKNTTLIPSGRPSHRVPFGTGKTVSKLLEGDAGLSTYAPIIFKELRFFQESLEGYFLTDLKNDSSLPPSITAYFELVPFREKIKEAKENTKSLDQFLKRFHYWWNAFQVMKFVHFARDEFYPNIPVAEASKILLEWNGLEAKKEDEALLLQYRSLDLSSRSLQFSK